MSDSQSMPNSRSRVLFLCHSASRNGATILLLDLLRWLKRETNYDIQVLVNGRGALLDELRAVGPTRGLEKSGLLRGSLSPKVEGGSSDLGSKRFASEPS